MPVVRFGTSGPADRPGREYRADARPSACLNLQLGAACYIAGN